MTSCLLTSPSETPYKESVTLELLLNRNRKLRQLTSELVNKGVTKVAFAGSITDVPGLDAYMTVPEDKGRARIKIFQRCLALW